MATEKKQMTVEDAVRALVAYGIRSELIGTEDAWFISNSLFDTLGLEPSSDYHVEGGENLPLEKILAFLLDDAVSRGRIEDGIASRDLFDTKLMGILTPRPSVVIRKFKKRYDRSPKEATDYFYKLCRDNDYIRRYRIAKDRKWVTHTIYGDFDITINLSKPEKDPRAIAAALTKKQDAYPQCLLCRENEGYVGRLDHPARENLRLIPMTLGGEQWYMQYSPYVYYNEHCIVLSERHTPMKIDRGTFVRLLEFVKMFPHYTIGSNADLPIVGGSILTHEHFQGGCYEFAMAKAPIDEQVVWPGYSDVETGIVRWPLSVLRLRGTSEGRIVELADEILRKWRKYSDESVDILAFSDETPHNTITPIARMRDGVYELDLVLRNNRTTEQYPLGIFHPHQELHHIKKENIGLIEVMGLAVLPSRLLSEMELLKKTILAGTDVHTVPALAAHADWADEILAKHPDFTPEGLKKGPSIGMPQAVYAAQVALRPRTLDAIVENEIGLVFSQVLEHCGVFKDTPEGREAFHRFIEEQI